MLKNIYRGIFKNRIPICVIIICLYALYLRIMVLYHHTLWRDELYQLNQMEVGFVEFLKCLQKNEFCSYLSGDLYLVYPFFKIFSYNKWGLAIPHILATIIGFYILYLICKMYFKSLWAYLITFSIICFNANLVWHATEIRPYAVLPTLALATFYLFQKLADLNFKISIPRKIAAIAFFCLVIWFYIYGIVIFTGNLMYILLFKYKEKNYKVYLRNAVSFIFVTLCVAMPFWLYSVFGSHLTRALVGYNIFEYIPDPMLNMTGFLKGIFCNLMGCRVLYFLFPGVVIPVVISYADRSKQLLFLIFLIIAPVGLVLLSDVMSKYYFLQRHFIWVMPLFAFFLGWTWDTFFYWLKRNSVNGM